MNVFLDLPVGLKEELWSHLLKNETEQVAFVFATVAVAGDATVFTTKDHYLAGPDDFQIHSEFHVELADEARAMMTKIRVDQPQLSQRWVRLNVPYQTPTLMERFLDGLRKAGLED